MTDIKRNLPDNQYKAAVNANTPSALNPFATETITSGLQSQINSLTPSNQLISGAVVWSGSGFTYNVTALSYRIQGVLFNTLSTSVTLTAADPTNPRIDVIYADNNGLVGFITGTPAPSPTKPNVDSLSQLELTFVTVPAGAVAPIVTNTLVYDENTGTPTEWAGTSDDINVDFASTNDPYLGTVSVETLSPLATNREIIFTPLAPYNVNGGTVNFRIKAKALMNGPSGILYIGFFNGATLLGNAVSIGGTGATVYGFNPYNITTYQLVAIPLAAFGVLPTTVGALRFFKTSGVSTANFFLDLVQIQEGVPTPPTLTAGHEILDETTPLTQRPKLSFQGAGVTATDDAINDQTVVTIPGGGATNLTVDSTGVLTGGVVSIGTPNTTFSISDGTGQIVDNLGVKTPISWTGLTNIPVTNIATQLITFVGINGAGVVIQQSSPFTNPQGRAIIVLAVVVHVNLTNVDAINNEQHVAYNVGASLYDGMESIGFFNISGNLYSANGANLSINKSVGTMFKMGSNYDTDINNPHVRTLGSLAPVTFQYRFSNGANGVIGTLIDPNNLDDGAGGLTAITANKWSVQRIYSFTSNNVKIQRGVSEYNTSELAIAGLTTELYITEPSIAANGLFRGWLVVKQGSTVLNTSTQAVFLPAGKFGDTIGGGGSGTATDLQTAYNNSTPNPEILTNVANGSVTVRRGSAADTDFIYEGKDGAGTTRFSVNGLGEIISQNVKKANLTAIVAPAVTDSVILGYAVGSIWLDVTADKSYVCLDNTNGAAVWKLTSGLTIEDEATPLTQRPTMNFTGAGVTVTDAGGKTVVTIPGGGGGGTKTVQIPLGTIVSSGAASSGFILDVNEITYFITGANPGTSKIVFLQFVIPADYNSGGTFRFSSKKAAAITTLTATAYINGTVDGVVNAVAIQPTATGVYELTTTSFGTNKTAGDIINLKLNFTGSNGMDINYRGISFNYTN